MGKAQTPGFLIERGLKGVVIQGWFASSVAVVEDITSSHRLGTDAAIALGSASAGMATQSEPDYATPTGPNPGTG